MSDFPFPKPSGAWHEVRVQDDPFPEQIRALMAIRDGLQRSAHFVETIFNPWNVAEKLSSPAAVKQLKAEQPQRCWTPSKPSRSRKRRTPGVR